MRYRNVAQLVLAGLALCAAVAACGGSGSGGAKPSGGSSSAPAGGSAAAQIKSNWETFFNAKTPAGQRIKLLQNGQAFASLINAQSGSSIASSVTAKVSKVTVVSGSQAKVTYSLLLGGTPALSGQTGVAVKEGGTWKVGDASFCGLLALQNGGSTKGLPSACSSAG